MVRTFVAFCCRRMPIMIGISPWWKQQWNFNLHICDLKVSWSLSHRLQGKTIPSNPSRSRTSSRSTGLSLKDTAPGTVWGIPVMQKGFAKRKALEAETFRNDSETMGESSDRKSSTDPKWFIRKIRKGLEADHFPHVFQTFPTWSKYRPKVTVRKGAQKSVVELESAKNAWCRRHLCGPERERHRNPPKPAFLAHWNRANQPTSSFCPVLVRGSEKLSFWRVAEVGGGGGRGEYQRSLNLYTCCLVDAMQVMAGWDFRRILPFLNLTCAHARGYGVGAGFWIWQRPVLKSLVQKHENHLRLCFV